MTSRAQTRRRMSAFMLHKGDFQSFILFTCLGQFPVTQQRKLGFLFFKTQGKLVTKIGLILFKLYSIRSWPSVAKDICISRKPTLGVH